ncbi:MAG: electron transport complex subunit RsxC [Lachnospiraceae bacterium]|jgi:electron transport complex protein RnfC|nr:electron transport complex subunit RsxC [Lachnospiraceae bacterium]
MTKGTFKGGVHPYEGKELSMDKPTVKLLPGKELVYPMSQHIGAPSKPIVAVGDHVLMGQKIAEAGGFVSVPISASVSGTVKEIKPTLTVSGSIVDAIYIENDEQYTPVEGLGTKRDYTKLSKQEIRDIVKEAGIVGMGGAGFPTHIKLTPKDENAIDYIIVNGSECEPYLTSDYRMMLEEGEKLVDGVRIILQLFDNAQGVIAIEDNKPKAIEHISELVKDETRIRVQVVRTKYPEGSERQLIKAVTGRKINSSMLPADAGCIVNNVDTVISIHMAVAETTPLMRRVVTVSGDAVVNPQNFNVKTGTKYSEVLEAAGGFKVKPEKLISGGTMMGMGLFDVNIPVTKTSSALLAFIKDPMLLVPEGPCIRCGRCVEACPENLIPQMMMEASERFDDASFEAISGMECMECGSCTFVCPAGRKLTQSLKQTRRSILDNRKKK